MFLPAFIFAFVNHKAAKENGKQKIRNALLVWKEDLGADYALLSKEIESE